MKILEFKIFMTRIFIYKHTYIKRLPFVFFFFCFLFFSNNVLRLVIDVTCYVILSEVMADIAQFLEQRF